MRKPWIVQQKKSSMKQIKSIALLLCAVVMLTPGCDHDTDIFDGPFLVDRFGEFMLVEGLTLNRQTVDFSAGETVVASARFNKRVNFSLVITGLESGAVKVIEGFDNEVNASNATWRGGTTDLPLFRNENCQVELVIPEQGNLDQKVQVEVTGRKVYEGNLYTGFEADPVDNIFKGNFEFELTAQTGRRNDGTSAQGDWYYFFEGTDNVVPNFFVGLIDIKASITGQTYAPVPTTVPEDLFFNAFVRSDGGPHGIAVIQIIVDANGTGEFEDGQDTVFPIGDLPLDFTGWKHVFVALGTIGISEAQTSQIVAIRALLISDNNSQPNPPLQVDYGLDFLTFTAGMPLQL